MDFSALKQRMFRANATGASVAHGLHHAARLERLTAPAADPLLKRGSAAHILALLKNLEAGLQPAKPLSKGGFVKLPPPVVEPEPAVIAAPSLTSIMLQEIQAAEDARLFEPAPEPAVEVVSTTSVEAVALEIPPEAAAPVVEVEPVIAAEVVVEDLKVVEDVKVDKKGSKKSKKAD